MKKKKYKNYFYLTIILLILLIGYGIYVIQNNNKNVIIDSSKDIVFTVYKSTSYKQEVPNINIKKLNNNINNEINKLVEPYLEKENVSIEYKYNINGNILSLIIIISETKDESAPNLYFKTYNINLKKLKVLSDKEVLNLFDTNKSKITKGINEIFTNYYNEELEYNIIPNMTYQEYLKMRKLDNINDKLYFYISNNNLEVFVQYNIFSEVEKSFYLEDVGYSFNLN